MSGSTLSQVSTHPLTDEADRLRVNFEAVARRELATMALSARSVVKAWAQAQIAIRAARQSGEPGAAALPDAEDFRVLQYLPPTEVSRERITRWCGNRTGPINQQQPLSDEDEANVVYRDGRWCLIDPSTGRIRNILVERADFDRITIAGEQKKHCVPLIADTLKVPSLLAGDTPGWDGLNYSDPESVLAYVEQLEAEAQVWPPVRALTVTYALVNRVSRPAAPAATV